MQCVARTGLEAKHGSQRGNSEPKKRAHAHQEFFPEEDPIREMPPVPNSMDAGWTPAFLTPILSRDRPNVARHSQKLHRRPKAPRTGVCAAQTGISCLRGRGQTTGSGSRSLKGRDPSSGSVGFRSCVILSAAKDSAVLAAQVPGSHPLGEEFSFHENVGSIARNSP